jgi:hypothetical protein
MLCGESRRGLDTTCYCISSSKTDTLTYFGESWIDYVHHETLSFTINVVTCKGSSETEWKRNRAYGGLTYVTGYLSRPLVPFILHPASKSCQCQNYSSRK